MVGLRTANWLRRYIKIFAVMKTLLFGNYSESGLVLLRVIIISENVGFIECVAVQEPTAAEVNIKAELPDNAVPKCLLDLCEHHEFRRAVRLPHAVTQLL